MNLNGVIDSLFHERWVAYIPVFDWRGPEFLAFYGVAFLAALIVSVRKVQAHRTRFELGEAVARPVALTDPYEMACLAGGRARVMQLAVLRLLKAGVAEWDKSLLLGPKLRHTGRTMPGGPEPVERALMLWMIGAGPKGWSAAQVANCGIQETQRLEAKLAAKGLRPTPEEMQTVGCGVWPLAVVMLLGLIKIVIGVSRDKPVGFLIMALVLTLFAAIAVTAVCGRRRSFITPSGTATLEQLRKDYPDTRSTDAEYDLTRWSLAPALFGVTAVAGLAGFAGIPEWLIKQPMAANSGSDGGSSGCSSSCGGGGGGGCGGGGCGGCGGS